MVKVVASNHELGGDETTLREHHAKSIFQSLAMLTFGSLTTAHVAVFPLAAWNCNSALFPFKSCSAFTCFFST